MRLRSHRSSNRDAHGQDVVGRVRIVRQTFTWDGGKIVYTNPANGKSVTTHLAGPAISVPNGDGTSTLTIPGNDQAVVAPGQGFIAGRTGLSIVIVDDATGAVLEVLKLAGHQDSPFPAGCVALARGRDRGGLGPPRTNRPTPASRRSG